MKKLSFIGVDGWDRPVYQDESGQLWKDVNLGRGEPFLHNSADNEFEGEPDMPIKGEYEIVKTGENPKMLEIQAVENKYGVVLFRMALTHLIDVGHRHLTEDSVTESIEQIETQKQESETIGINPVMTPAFQCNIFRCAYDLSRFSIWEIITYIKGYVFVDKEYRTHE